MFEEKNRVAKSFLSLRNLIENNGIPDDGKLVFHVHEKTMPGHERKYNCFESSEVAALIFGEQHGKLEIVLRRRSEYDANGFEKLELINFVNRMYDLLAYPLLFPYGKDRWNSTMEQKDSKGNVQKISPKKILFTASVRKNM